MLSIAPLEDQLNWLADQEQESKSLVRMLSD